MDEIMEDTRDVREDDMRSGESFDEVPGEPGCYVYRPGMLAEMAEQEMARQEQLFEMAFFGVCDTGTDADL